jgi:hypothetical protein
MRVSLKKADLLARTALKAATETKYDPTLRLSIYAPTLTGSFETDEVMAEFVKARAKLFDQHDLSIELFRATYAIRAQLGVANVQHGISARLTEDKCYAAEEGRMRALLKALELETRGETSTQALRAKAQAIREQPSDRYGSREDTVTMAAFTEDDVANLRRQLKRIVDMRANINDALTLLNVSNSITLDETTVATLRKAEILS